MSLQIDVARPRTRLTGVAVASLLAFVLCACGSSKEDTDVGRACRPVLVPEGGFRPTEILLEHPQHREVYVGSFPSPDLCEMAKTREECWEPNPWLCTTDMCVVNGYEGDLVLDASEGDGIPETEEACGEACGFTGIGDRVHCTCKCDAPDGADPPTCDACPGGLVCCSLLWFGPTAGSYCVREGTCPTSQQTW